MEESSSGKRHASAIIVASLVAACSVVSPAGKTGETVLNDKVKSPPRASAAPRKASPTPSPEVKDAVVPTAKPSQTPSPTPTATPTPAASATPTPASLPTGSPGLTAMSITPNEVSVFRKTTAGLTVGLSFVPVEGNLAVKLAVVGEPKAIAAAEVRLVETSGALDPEEEATEYRLAQVDDGGGDETATPSPIDGEDPTPPPTPEESEEPLPPRPSVLATPTPVPTNVFRVPATEMGLATSLASGFHEATIALNRPELLKYVKLDPAPRVFVGEIHFKDQGDAAVLSANGKPLIVKVRIRIK